MSDDYNRLVFVLLDASTGRLISEHAIFKIPRFLGVVLALPGEKLSLLLTQWDLLFANVCWCCV